MADTDAPDTCPYCGSVCIYQWLPSDTLSVADTGYMHCEQCGGIWHDPSLHSEEQA